MCQAAYTQSNLTLGIDFLYSEVACYMLNLKILLRFAHVGYCKRSPAPNTTLVQRTSHSVGGAKQKFRGQALAYSYYRTSEIVVGRTSQGTSVTRNYPLEFVCDTISAALPCSCVFLVPGGGNLISIDTFSL